MFLSGSFFKWGFLYPQANPLLKSQELQLANILFPVCNYEINLVSPLKLIKMKSIKKTSEALGLLSPILILIFACSLYMIQPHESNNVGTTIQKSEIKNDHSVFLDELMIRNLSDYSRD